jgi:hypothetical protein
LERLLFVALLGAAAVAIADGPGSRLLTTPEAPKPGVSPAAEKDQQRCEAMAGEQKERCMRALRSATGATARPPHEGPGPASGPESVGGGSNAGSGASTGTSGGSSAVGGAR